MFILDNPYVSDFLQDTALKCGFPVLKNSATQSLGLNPALDYICNSQAIEKIQNGEKIYCNSENAIDWISDNLKNTEIPSKINLCKNKAAFRKLISKIYPDFYFEEIPLDKIKNINPEKLKFPLVLKPNVGFLSFGVYVILNKDEWQNTVNTIEYDIEKFKTIFPKTVVNTSSFIIEEMIEGEEFAVDVYFDNTGSPVVLNIFKHPFSGTKDVSDRVYYTSKEIIGSYLDKFTHIFEKIGTEAGFKNFPCHIELRANDKNIIPIEINPMRFAGWCLCDLAHFAWDINVYEYFFNNKRPDWENILKTKDNCLYYFLVAENPVGIDKQTCTPNWEKFLKNIKNPLEIRKLDHKKHPLFGILFAKTDSYSEIENILKLNMEEFFK